MTVTANETGAEVETIVVRDAAGPLSFRGETIADLSWSYEEAEQRGYPRWTDISLHRVFDSDKYAYVIQIMGRSVIYHNPGLPCKRGITMRVGLLREDDDRYQALLACEQCNPIELEELSDDAMVAYEQDIPTLYKCADAEAVVKIFQSRSRYGVMSGINLKILQTASALDRSIADAMIKLRSL